MILTVWTQKFVGRAEIQIKMCNWRSAHDEQKHTFGPALVSIYTRWDICTFSVFNENHNLSRRVFALALVRPVLTARLIKNSDTGD